MSLFTKSRIEPARELTVQEQRAARESELLETIRELDARIETMQRLESAFRKDHFTILNNEVVFAVSDMASVASLRESWSILCSETARLARLRSCALSEWSELCGSREVRHAG